jgi:hypothetical protein
LTKNAPAITTNTQIATFTTTSALVTRDDCRMPSVATAPSSSGIAMAPTLTTLLSPNRAAGSPNGPPMRRRRGATDCRQRGGRQADTPAVAASLRSGRDRSAPRR